MIRTKIEFKKMTNRKQVGFFCIDKYTSNEETDFNLTVTDIDLDIDADSKPISNCKKQLKFVLYIGFCLVFIYIGQLGHKSYFALVNSSKVEVEACDNSGGYNDCRNVRGKTHVVGPDEMNDDFSEEEPQNFWEKIEDEYGSVNTDYTPKIEIPKELSHLANLDIAFNRSTDIPLFWHIPRAAGEAMQDIFSYCFRLVVASQIGATHGHERDKNLEVVTEESGAKYINIDTTTRDGIEKAQNLNLASSGLVDVIYTSYLYGVSKLILTENHKGKCFTLIRHPMERAISLYHHLQHVDEKKYKQISFLEFVKTEYREDNWMIRFLVNKEFGDLYERDFELAKNILQKKCLIGILEELGVSMKRFETYFKFDQGFVDEKCLNDVIYYGINVDDHSYVENEQQIKYILEKRNFWDLKLYEYSRGTLFKDQATLIA